MKIISQTSFYAEPQENTDRLIKSLDGIVDFAFFQDGRYCDFDPESQWVNSSPEQRAWMRQALDRTDIPSHEIARASDGIPWKSQAEKRTAMWSNALLHARDWMDYHLIIDADEELIVEDLTEVRIRLIEELPDAILVSLNTPGPDNIEVSLKGTQSPRNSTSVHGRGVARIFRSFPDFWVDPEFHGCYLARNERGEVICLKDRGQKYRSLTSGVKTADMSDLITIVNHTWRRSPERLAAKHKYGVARAEKGYDL